jgi:predicted dehydrogenase
MKKIIFFGLGSIGVRHARILKQRKDIQLFAFRTYKGQQKNHLAIPEVNRWDEVDRIKPDVAFITNPTSLHIDTAIQCAKRGMHLFIEKPMGSQTKQLTRLLATVARQKRTTYVAYVLRFHPMIKRIKKELERNRLLHLRVSTTSYLPSWRAGRDHLKGYSASKRMGGGVIYDLSHELDLVWFFLGEFKEMKGNFGRHSDVTVDAEDYADICIQTNKGPANVHMNFLSQLTQRIIQIDFKEKAIVADLNKNVWEEYRQGQLVKKKIYKGNLDDCFEEQIDYFLKNLHNQRMMNNVFDAAPLFKQIYQFKHHR